MKIYEVISENKYSDNLGKGINQEIPLNEGVMDLVKWVFKQPWALSKKISTSVFSEIVKIWKSGNFFQTMLSIGTTLGLIHIIGKYAIEESILRAKLSLNEITESTYKTESGKLFAILVGELIEALATVSPLILISKVPFLGKFFKTLVGPVYVAVMEYLNTPDGRKELAEIFATGLTGTILSNLNIMFQELVNKALDAAKLAAKSVSTMSLPSTDELKKLEPTSITKTDMDAVRKQLNLSSRNPMDPSFMSYYGKNSK